MGGGEKGRRGRRWEGRGEGEEGGRRGRGEGGRWLYTKPPATPCSSRFEHLLHVPAHMLGEEEVKDERMKGGVNLGTSGICPFPSIYTPMPIYPLILPFIPFQPLTHSHCYLSSSPTLPSLLFLSFPTLPSLTLILIPPPP